MNMDKLDKMDTFLKRSPKEIPLRDSFKKIFRGADRAVVAALTQVRWTNVYGNDLKRICTIQFAQLVQVCWTNVYGNDLKSPAQVHNLSFRGGGGGCQAKPKS